MIARRKAFSLKKYGEFYKFTVYGLTERNNNIIPSEWFEFDKIQLPWPGDYEDEVPEFEEVRNKTSEGMKMQNNLSRSKSMIYEYGMSNDWDFFCTFTISPDKYDRYNLKGWYKDFAKWINHYNEHKCIDLAYLFIPEQHKDGAWHIHGFISGLPTHFLSNFIPGVHPQHLIDNEYLNWPDYEKRFGFCSLAPLRNKVAAAAYVLKYAGKDIGKLNLELGEYLYFASRGLNKAEHIISGEVTFSEYADIKFAFENDYTSSLYLTEDELKNNDQILDIIGGMPGEV